MLANGPGCASTGTGRATVSSTVRRAQSRRKGMRAMFKSTSISLILLGVLGVIVGIIASVSPKAPLPARDLLFAIYALIGAGLQAMRAFRTAPAGPVFGHLLLALIDLAAGVAALVWPGPTAL